MTWKKKKNKNIYLFGFSISHVSRSMQFIILSSNLFIFTITYGLVQELVTVKMASRRLGLFISVCQFLGYTIWSFVLSMRYPKKEYGISRNIPFLTYLCLSVLRAIDVNITNLSMQYLNYPTKTIIKSSRVAFTILTGQITGKKYKGIDYFIAFVIVAGLVIFLHADSSASVVFHPLGICMLVSVLHQNLVVFCVLNYFLL